MLWLALLLYQVTPGGGSSGQPPRVDPGNDPLVTLIATVIFVLVSIGGGVLVFKLRNKKHLN